MRRRGGSEELSGSASRKRRTPSSSAPKLQVKKLTPSSGLAEHGVVVSVSSFSKILGTGLRVGWIEAAPAIVDELRRHPYILSGGGVTPFMEQMMCEVIESGDDAQKAEAQSLLDQLH